MNYKLLDDEKIIYELKPIFEHLNKEVKFSKLFSIIFLTGTFAFLSTILVGRYDTSCILFLIISSLLSMFWITVLLSFKKLLYTTYLITNKRVIRICNKDNKKSYTKHSRYIYLKDLINVTKREFKDFISIGVESYDVYGIDDKKISRTVGFALSFLEDNPKIYEYLISDRDNQ